MKTAYRVEPDEAGERLDVFLTSRLGGLSRAKVQKRIKAGDIAVNGQSASAHLILKKDDEVTLKADIEPAKTRTELVPRRDIAFDVVHEDADVVVVNKPAGLLVHPAVEDDRETLAHGLIARWPAMATVGESPDRPGIMHRLDKDASGLMVVAKTKKAYDSLKRQFQKHTIHKEYAVLVNGAPPDDSGVVNLMIGRKKGSGKMAARAVPREGDREAVTHYHVDEHLPKATLLTVRTETGRTHQIRAHMHALGCTVVGDPLYGVDKEKLLRAPRLFLHAKKLGFTHPATRRKLEFSSALPDELETVLASLRSKG
jgi:23S rRNA pseudouridine1911/1915/1917 synthase